MPDIEVSRSLINSLSYIIWPIFENYSSLEVQDHRSKLSYNTIWISTLDFQGTGFVFIHYFHHIMKTVTLDVEGRRQN